MNLEFLPFEHVFVNSWISEIPEIPLLLVASPIIYDYYPQKGWTGNPAFINQKCSY
jgi:hypothetical protein